MVTDPPPLARPRATGKTRRPSPTNFLAATVIAMMLAAIPPAMAQDPEPQLTFHDEEDTRSSTTVSCEFWVAGHNMRSPDGRLEAAHELDGPSAHGHPLGNYSGTANDNGTFDFFVGPFTLHASDEYLVVAIPDNGSSRGAAADLTYIACGDEDEEDPFAPFSCPADLTATANGDGSVALSWTGTEEADRYVVHRKLASEEGFAAFEEVATTETTTYSDTTTKGGVTYAYYVEARQDTVDGTMRAGCGAAQVTTIPDFGVLAGTIVGVALVGMYALARRRR